MRDHVPAKMHERVGTEDLMQKAVAVVVIAFAAFFLLTQPEAAADVVKGVVDVVGSLFETVIDFLNALFD